MRLRSKEVSSSSRKGSSGSSGSCSRCVAGKFGQLESTFTSHKVKFIRLLVYRAPIRSHHSYLGRTLLPCRAADLERLTEGVTTTVEWPEEPGYVAPPATERK